MRPSKHLKELSISEFTKAADKYESDHAGVYNICKKDYPDFWLHGRDGDEIDGGGQREPISKGIRHMNGESLSKLNIMAPKSVRDCIFADESAEMTKMSK